MNPWLVFLHGINAADDHGWLEPLNAAITRFGHEAFAADRVLTPDYRAALRGETRGVRAPSTLWKGLSKDERRPAETAYVSRMAFLESRVRPLANATPPPLRPPDLDAIPSIAGLLDDAGRYLRSADVRAAVQDIVVRSIASLPADTPIVIVAHSLGSVIAADVIKKVPAHVRVAALVTIGCPLGAVAKFRSQDLDDFPFDRLHAWVNVYEPRDPVTGAKGISKHYPWAIDIPVTLQDWVVPEFIHQHGAEYYCSHPAVAAAITGALVGTDVESLGFEVEPGIEGLELLLLQSLYLRELAKRLPTDDLDRISHLERARQFTAESHASAAVAIHERNEATTALPAAEFLRRPDTHLRGIWDDQTVLALAITLSSGPPAPPFTIEEKPDTPERRDALVATLSLIRDHRDPTDVDMVDAIYSARDTISRVFPQGHSWIPVALVAAGVVALGATGVGLAAAAPAGLAGAALITSTLAAFGPGGMVGGMATLAALAGAGSAMAAVGATLGTAGITRRTPDLLATALDEAIASQNPGTLRSLLVSLLTLVAAQEGLAFPTQREQALVACANVAGRLSVRVRAHKSIDPKSEASKAAQSMLDLLGKACAWLRGERGTDSLEAEQWNQISTAYSQAVDKRSAPRRERLALPTRQERTPPALGSGSSA